jgi:hypothetical protein
MQVPFTIIIGVLLGSWSPFHPVGAGVLGTLALLFLYPKMSTLKVVGTDLAHAIPLTAVAGFGHWSLGMYKYDAIDQQIVDERVKQYRDQTRRYLAGELSEDEFRPLRLQNGLYIQRHAPMLRIAVPYGMLLQ